MMLVIRGFVLILLLSTSTAFSNVGLSPNLLLHRQLMCNGVCQSPYYSFIIGNCAAESPSLLMITKESQQNTGTQDKAPHCSDVLYDLFKQLSLRKGLQMPTAVFAKLVMMFSGTWVPLGLMSTVLAFSPNLAGSPLEKAKPQIIVEGTARVVDGDTLVIETASGQKERVRLLGIDAPESKQICQDKTGGAYACGLEAKQSLEKIVGRDPVACVAAKRDQYSRILGVCFDKRTGQELNKELVSEGEAVAYIQYSKAYITQEEAAKQQGRGVWKGKFQRPWEYRKEKRSGSKQTPPAGKVPRNEAAVLLDEP